VGGDPVGCIPSRDALLDGCLITKPTDHPVSHG